MTAIHNSHSISIFIYGMLHETGFASHFVVYHMEWHKARCFVAIRFYNCYLIF